MDAGDEMNDSSVAVDIIENITGLTLDEINNL